MNKQVKTIISCGLTSLLLGFYGCNSGNNEQRSTKAAVGPHRDTVTINMMAFHPDTLTVNKGDTVVWINQDIVAHDVSHFPDRSWHSDTLNPHAGVFVKVIEDSAGYFCSIHPTMTGKILIQQ